MSGPFDSESEAGGHAGPSPTGHINVTRAVVLVVVAVVLGVVLLHTVTRSSSAATSAPTTTVPRKTPPKAPTTTTTTVPHASVTVLVANGTTEPNVATHFTQVLTTQGWKTLPPADTSTPVTPSNVYYAAGQQNAANEVATALGLKLSTVQPLTTTVPVPDVGGADVVAVIGTVLAGSGFPASGT